MRLTALGLALALLAGCAGTPTDDMPRRERVFMTLDTDKNGELTPLEFVNGVVQEGIAVLDLDGNERLTLDEWAYSEEGERERSETEFQALDSNGDGELDYDEFATYPEKVQTYENMFKTLDRNGDGIVTLEELRQGDER